MIMLKPNDLYENESISTTQYYASKAVDSFLLDFQYDFKGDRKVDIEYQYNVSAELVGTVLTEKLDEVVWDRNFILMDSKSDKKVATDEFAIMDEVSIDYDTYFDLVRLYEKTYDIAIDAILKVRFNIVYDINLSEVGIGTKRVEDYIELDIPVIDTVTQVKENFESNISENVVPEIENLPIKRNICYVFAGVFFFVGVIIIFIKLRKNKISLKKTYERKVNHILKEYRDIIVTVVDRPDFGSLKIMEVAILEDLIDVAEQSKGNIIHYEDLESKENLLCVIVGDYVFLYRIV